MHVKVYLSIDRSETVNETAERLMDLAEGGYMVNVASYQHGVGYGAWTRVDGFSEAVIAWIAASEETMH